MGSARQLTNAYGMVTFGQAFDPFGSVTGTQGYDTTHYGFTGEWEDTGGMLFLRARYYDAGQGRFLSRDPFPGYLSQPSTLNAYAYTLNNPATLTDPSGEISPIAIIAIAGFAAGAVYDAYQQTDGFTDFCQYDILQTLSAGVGGAAAASLTSIMLVSGVGMLGMGLQGVALGLSGIGISAGVSTSLFIAGTTTVSWAGMTMTWLFSSLQFPENSKVIQNPMSRLPIRNSRSDKTSGILIVDSEEILLESGWNGPAADMPPQSPGFNIVTRTHVEGHAAAIMRQKNVDSGILLINNPPCPSCKSLLPRMLPEKSTLRIIGPDGYDTIFKGLDGR